MGGNACDRASWPSCKRLHGGRRVYAVPSCLRGFSRGIMAAMKLVDVLSPTAPRSRRRTMPVANGSRHGLACSRPLLAWASGCSRNRGFRAPIGGPLHLHAAPSALTAHQSQPLIGLAPCCTALPAPPYGWSSSLRPGRVRVRPFRPSHVRI